MGQQVTFDFWMRFKLGRLADWAGMLMTRHRAPSAAIRIRLTMRSSGSAHVTFISSDIPSQRFYIDWKVNQEYSMTDCDERQFRGFIEAGKCKDAPVASRFDARLETKAIA